MIIIGVEIALVFSVGFLSPKLFQHEDDALATNMHVLTEAKGNEVKSGKRENEKTKKQEKEKVGKHDGTALFSSTEPPKAAIIIDDFGNHTKTAYAFFDLEGPLNCTFLPKRPFTKKSIELAKEKGHQIMLHLPMEPYRAHITNPGNLAIWTYMTDEEIRKTVVEALNSVPGAVGADNHMGSKAMEDERVLTAVLKVFKEQNLFFIDSETTAKTVLNKVARNLGVKTRANRVFLDNKKELSYVIGRIRLLGDVAIRNGEVIGIGHVNTVTALALQVGIPLLKRRGIELVPVSELIK